MLAAKNKFFIHFIITLISVILLFFIISKADWSNFDRVKIEFQPVAIIFSILSVVTVFFLRTVTIFLFLPKPVTTQFQALLLPSSKYQLPESSAGEREVGLFQISNDPNMANKRLAQVENDCSYTGKA